MRLTEPAIDWVTAYRSTGDRLESASASVAPVAGVITANVDDVYFIDESRLATLIATASRAVDREFGSGLLIELTPTILDRVKRSRVCTHHPVSGPKDQMHDGRTTR